MITFRRLGGKNSSLDAKITAGVVEDDGIEEGAAAGEASVGVSESSGFGAGMK
jgi:hypothetical protein